MERAFHKDETERGRSFFKDKLLLLDGAMGTELQKRGLPPGGVPELLNLTDPELLKEVYRDYAAAGRRPGRRRAPAERTGAGPHSRG